MLVFVIIGILASFAVPRVLRTAAKAQRTELITMMEKMKLHFINAYRNGGRYPVPAGVDPSADFASDFNPPDDVTTLGRPLAWIPSRSGWSTYTFPPDGSLKMRYQYFITIDGSHLVLYAKGTLPGFDGVYTYTESYNGESLEAGYPIEGPTEL
jgi:type II secretory pathway pseudopilin PulG